MALDLIEYRRNSPPARQQCIGKPATLKIGDTFTKSKAIIRKRTLGFDSAPHRNRTPKNDILAIEKPGNTASEYSQCAFVAILPVHWDFIPRSVPGRLKNFLFSSCSYLLCPQRATRETLSTLFAKDRFQMPLLLPTGTVLGRNL